MKVKLLLLPFLFILFSTHGQSVVANGNSGSVSSDNLMYTVGEVYVVPTNADEANSGILGILYQVELQVLGVDDVDGVQSMSIFPNPVNQQLHISVPVGQRIESIQLYDIGGKHIGTYSVIANTVNLEQVKTGIYVLKTNVKTIKPIKLIKL